MINQLCDLLERGGFDITKWVSNSRMVLSSVPPPKRSKNVKSLELNVGISLPVAVERALGVHWKTEEDQLGMHIRFTVPGCTRRKLLSLMSSVSDPLGMVTPYVLLAKMIFQSECKLGKGWDERLNAENEQKWII